ncbi:MAG: pentapeptide repeat-containing protein [bacterium]|nr:pentapeptide repeat-containing protein [bacterium]
MKRLRRWWKGQSGSARLRLGLLFILVTLAAGFSAAGLLNSGDWGGFFLNLGTELAGAALTFVLLDQLLANRERREAIEEQAAQMKTMLIDRMASAVREVAVPAADELRRQNWLLDGSMVQVDLRRANLERVNLANADLREVNLYRARLNQADLWRANLADADLGGAWLNSARLWDVNLEGANLWQARAQNADFRRANLGNAEVNETKLDGADLREVSFKGANLRDARLIGANLHEADLTEADLTGANLSGCNLREAILRRAVLDQAIFDADTVLPDGKRWSPALDLSGYLDDE